MRPAQKIIMIIVVVVVALAAGFLIGNGTIPTPFTAAPVIP